MDTQLVKFLDSHIVSKDTDYTHTTKPYAGSRGRRLFIPDEDLDKFYELYCDTISSGCTQSITEKPEEIIPLLVDVDFKCNLEDGKAKRYYKPKHVRDIIEIYQSIIAEIVQKQDAKYFICCVLEKNNPVLHNGKSKDGFHLHFPFFHTEHWVQKEYIRGHALERMHARKMFKDLPTTDPLSSIIDKNIPGNAWLMYGSSKDPGTAEPYLLTKVYNKDLEIVDAKCLFSSKKYSTGNRKWNYPRFFSIRGDFIPIPLNTDIVKRQIEIKKVAIQHKRSLDQILSDLITSEMLLKMIKDSRVNDYREWMELGWILFNIGEGHQKALDQWIEFSKKSDKFEEGKCEKEWAKMDMRHYTIGSLKHMAKVDSPKDYAEYQNEYIKGELLQGISQAHNDIAKILFIMYEGQYICADMDKDGIWYEFRGHRWVRVQKGLGLRKSISKELTDKYLSIIAYYTNLAASKESEDEKNMYTSKIMMTSKLIEKLKNNTFKNCVMKEAMEYFYDEHFVERMDENSHLLVFENCVYDARYKLFRAGRPDDYCTKTTGLFYSHYNKTDPRVTELMDIFHKTFVNEKLFKFFEQTISDLILGGNRHKIFVIWTGDGDNGKSIIADLLDHAFGDYFYTPPTTLLTGKQNQASGATSELVPCKGARVVLVSETGNADVLNCGVMKKLTGGDPFYARGLFKEPTKIIPHFKLILHCNKMPNISAEDKASWNRIRVLPFESTFVKREVLPETEQEQWEKKVFPMDKTLKDRLPDLADVFMWWMIKNYEKYGDKDLYEPAEVKCATSNYHKTNDFYIQFLDERIKETKNKEDLINITMIWQLFKEWFKDAYPSRNIPARQHVVEAMEKKLGKANKGVWRGFIIYDPNDDDPEV